MLLPPKANSDLKNVLKDKTMVLTHHANDNALLLKHLEGLGLGTLLLVFTIQRLRAALYFRLLLLPLKTRDSLLHRQVPLFIWIMLWFLLHFLFWLFSSLFPWCRNWS